MSTTKTNTKKAITTKTSAKAVKAIETPVETPVETIERVTTMDGFDLTKMLKFDDVMSLATACGVGTSHTTRDYRIFHNNSSLHVHVKQYKFFMSPTDYERAHAVAKVLTNTVFVDLRNPDPKRPYTVEINDTADLATIFKAIAPLNALR
jgi:hypothetical protein